MKASSRNKYISQSREQIEQLLDSIPHDLDHLSLTESLRSVCELLSHLDELTSNAFLRERIKKRFGLTNEEARDYQNLICSYRAGQSASAPADETVRPHHPVVCASFDGLIDIVEDSGKVLYLVKDGDLPVVKDKVEIGDSTLIPPRRSRVPFLLPRADEVLKHYEDYRNRTAQEVDAELYDSLLRYYRGYVELPHEGAYHLLVCWTLHTYLPEGADHSPFILFEGTPGRGKTRCGKAMIYVAYRGLHVETMRAPHLIRVTRDLNATLFVDVRDPVRKMTSQDSGDIILLRIERGAMVPRVLHPGREAFEDTEYFPVFGATVLTSNESLDEVVLGRAIPIKMPYTHKAFPMPTPDAGIALREMLDAFRAYHFGNRLPDCEHPFHGRMGDVSKPFVQMIRLTKPESEHLLMEFLDRVEGQKKLQKLETLEARIIKAVCDLAGSVRNGRLPIKAIHQKLNTDRDSRSQIDPSLIGRRLGTLGFDKAKTSGGYVAIIWDTDLIQTLAAQYDLPPLPPLTPSHPGDRSAAGVLRKMGDLR